MLKSSTKPVSEVFFNKYDQAHAERYFDKHRGGLSRRLSHRRDEQIVRGALVSAGNPVEVLDLPCGAGRFWPILTEQANRILIAADNSAEMLKVEKRHQLADFVAPIRYLQTSAFAIDLPENAVDSIFFCMRLLHHIASAENWLLILQEFHRICRETMIVSLWVDSNYKS